MTTALINQPPAERNRIKILGPDKITIFSNFETIPLIIEDSFENIINNTEVNFKIQLIDSYLMDIYIQVGGAEPNNQLSYI